jgi:hypothetical protein
VPGVTVSGKVPYRGPAKLKVGGSAAARGMLTITERGKVTGRLGGQKISGRFLAAAAAQASAARQLAQGLYQQRLELFKNTFLPKG